MVGPGTTGATHGFHPLQVKDELKQVKMGFLVVDSECDIHVQPGCRGRVFLRSMSHLEQ